MAGGITGGKACRLTFPESEPGNQRHDGYNESESSTWVNGLWLLLTCLIIEAMREVTRLHTELYD